AMHKCLKVARRWHESPFGRVASVDFADEAHAAPWRTPGCHLSIRERRFIAVVLDPVIEDTAARQ
uniref:hypothetical protein n=1 Tax=Pseudomonas viridiflava TaxID=33069 RepID=UPI00197E1C38